MRNEALLQQHWTQCFAIKISVVSYIIIEQFFNHKKFTMTIPLQFYPQGIKKIDALA